MTLLVTGGAGFIGSQFIHYWSKKRQEKIINIDALTYAGQLNNIDTVPFHTLIKGSICDQDLCTSLLFKYTPHTVIHFAAETHVDRSIESAEVFVQTNVLGTQRLLNAILKYYAALSQSQQAQFKFLHISTDEVYGSRHPEESPRTETSSYLPNNPYSASKAASDHMVRAYHQTYNLPTLTTHCSNNYGPGQYPEKLIPVMIQKALKKEPLPLYGDGQNLRDWLYVDDHCRALDAVLQHGKIGEVYNIGAYQEKKNTEVVQLLCHYLDAYAPRDDGISYTNQITFVKDRMGHDQIYRINWDKLHKISGWSPHYTFETGLLKTIKWYLTHTHWYSPEKKFPACTLL